jgi:hypothetical protein
MILAAEITQVLSAEVAEQAGGYRTSAVKKVQIY